jgi:hypothetical protein
VTVCVPHGALILYQRWGRLRGIPSSPVDFGLVPGRLGESDGRRGDCEGKQGGGT